MKIELMVHETGVERKNRKNIGCLSELPGPQWRGWSEKARSLRRMVSVGCRYQHQHHRFHKVFNIFHSFCMFLYFLQYVTIVYYTSIPMCLSVSDQFSLQIRNKSAAGRGCYEGSCRQSAIGLVRHVPSVPRVE